MRPLRPRLSVRHRQANLTIWAISLLLLTQSSLPAGQGLPARPAGDCEDSKWKWLYPFWFHKNGWPKYGSALQHHTHSRMERLPICPPVGDVQFGYHEPCWRQLEVFPRCWSCDGHQQQEHLPPIPAIPQHQPPSSVPAPPNAATVVPATLEITPTPAPDSSRENAFFDTGTSFELPVDEKAAAEIEVYPAEPIQY